jgi:hypothetical protein
MTEREQLIESFVNDEGWPRWEAEQIAEDYDLWILRPGVRYAFSGEEAVEQWRAAAAHLGALFECLGCYSGGLFNEATTMALQDAAERAREALRRAEQRLANTAEE